MNSPIAAPILRIPAPDHIFVPFEDPALGHIGRSCGCLVYRLVALQDRLVATLNDSKLAARSRAILESDIFIGRHQTSISLSTASRTICFKVFPPTLIVKMIGEPLLPLSIVGRITPCCQGSNLFMGMISLVKYGLIIRSEEHTAELQARLHLRC